MIAALASVPGVGPWAGRGVTGRRNLPGHPAGYGATAATDGSAKVKACLAGYPGGAPWPGRTRRSSSAPARAATSVNAAAIAVAPVAIAGGP